MKSPGRTDAARLAWQLRAARWGGKGGNGYLHSGYCGYASVPLAQLHAAFKECLRDLEGSVSPRRITLFEAFYGLAAPPIDASTLAQHFHLSYGGVLASVRAIETHLAQRLKPRWDVRPKRLQPAPFDPHCSTAGAAISAAMAEAVGDKLTVAALNELRHPPERAHHETGRSHAESSRMMRLRTRHRALCLAGYHQQAIKASQAARRLVPSTRRIGLLSQGQDLEHILYSHLALLPADYDTAVYELTRKPGPNPQLVTAIAESATEALIAAERDVEPLLSAIAAQFLCDRRNLDPSRRLALAAVQAVRTALAREMEDLVALHLADSALQLVGSSHPLGQQALRDAVLTLRAHEFFPQAAAFLREFGAVAKNLPESPDRNIAIGHFLSHKVGLALSIGRARARGNQPREPADLLELMQGTLNAANAIELHNPAGDLGFVATLRRRASELAFTWPEASASRRVLSHIFEWADESRGATARLGQLQWSRSAMVVALQTRDEETFHRWDLRAEMLATGAPWHFTVLREITELRQQARRLGFFVPALEEQTSQLIAASTSDLSRLARYTARPAKSGSKLLLVV